MACEMIALVATYQRANMRISWIDLRFDELASGDDNSMTIMASPVEQIV